jgi:hypothetical protein
MNQVVKKRMESAILDAEQAADRYSKGQLTELEIKVGCNASELYKTWLGLVKERKQRLEEYINRPEPPKYRGKA